MSSGNTTAARPIANTARVANRESEPHFSLGSSVNPDDVILVIAGQVYQVRSKSFLPILPNKDTESLDSPGNLEGYHWRELRSRRVYFHNVERVLHRAEVLSAEMASDDRNQDAIVGIRPRQGSPMESTVNEEPKLSGTSNAEVGWFNAAIFSLGGMALIGILVMLFSVYVLDGWVSTGWVVDVVTIGGALAVSLAGIAWIVVAWIMIGITVKGWWKSRS